MSTDTRDVARTSPTARRLAPSAAIAAAFVLLGCCLILTALTVSWRPVHDFAFLELAVRDLGGRETPLVGPYSRYGWSHPGPVLFLLLALPYRVLGGASNGLLVGAALVNLASLGGILVVARRHGGTLLLGWSAVLILVLARSLGGEVLVSPWNPYVTIVPLVLFLLLAWAVTLGDHVALPFVVGVGTFLIQTHVQYGLVVVAVGAWAVGWYVAGARHAREGNGARGGNGAREGNGARGAPGAKGGQPWWIATALVALVLWIPPIVDQVAGSGNLSSLARFFWTTDEAGPGRRAALGIVGRETGLLGSWTTGDIPLGLFTGQVTPGSWWTWLIPVAALATAAVIARRRHDHRVLALLGVAAIAVGATTFSATRWVGPVWDYLVIWIGAVGVVVWLAVGWAVLRPITQAIRRRIPPGVDRSRLHLGAGLALGLALVLLLGTTPDLVGADPPEVERGELVERLDDDVAAALADVDGPVLVRPVDSPAAAFPAPSSRQLAAGLALALERRGTPARVIDQDWELGPGSGGARMFGNHRAERADAVGTLTVVSGRALDEYVPPADAVEVARIDDDEARRRQERLEAELVDTFEDLGHPDAAALVPTDRLSELIWTTPELASYAPQIRTILDLRETPRAAVWWQATS